MPCRRRVLLVLEVHNKSLIRSDLLQQLLREVERLDAERHEDVYGVVALEIPQEQLSGASAKLSVWMSSGTRMPMTS